MATNFRDFRVYYRKQNWTVDQIVKFYTSCSCYKACHEINIVEDMSPFNEFPFYICSLYEWDCSWHFLENEF